MLHSFLKETNKSHPFKEGDPTECNRVTSVNHKTKLLKQHFGTQNPKRDKIHLKYKTRNPSLHPCHTINLLVASSKSVNEIRKKMKPSLHERKMTQEIQIQNENIP
jgi:hypothetical protein